MEPGAADALASLFKALSDPTRVAIVNRLACCDECCVCDLTSVFAVSQPTVSHHLRKLREAGLLESERRGSWVYYRVSPGVLAVMARLLAPAAG